MAHVHGMANTAAAKNIAKMGTAKALEHDAAAMLAQGAAQTGSSAVSFHNLTSAAASSAAAATQTGRALMSRLIGNPWVLFGLGVGVGFMVHKYRKDIIGAANRAAETGKDFVLQQRENLEDIVAETKASEA